MQGEILGFKLTSPAPDDNEMKSSPYVLIRHGTSEWNWKSAEAEHNFGKNSKESDAIDHDPNGFDPELHEFGILQAEKH